MKVKQETKAKPELELTEQQIADFTKPAEPTARPAVPAANLAAPYRKARRLDGRALHDGRRNAPWGKRNAP